jgi:hypothetical protein
MLPWILHHGIQRRSCEVKTWCILVPACEPRDDSKRLRVSLETTAQPPYSRLVLKYLFGDVTERRMAQIVRHGRRLYDIGIDAAELVSGVRLFPRDFLSESPGDLSHF